MEFNRNIWGKKHWASLILILSLSLFIRQFFFNGFYGGDDFTYFTRSYDIANGLWESADYNGSLRYGYNIPSAFFIWLLGPGLNSANAWTMFCSLAEVAIVFLFASRYINLRAAVIAALILSSFPLHIALATRIHADSVMAFFLTLSFILFFVAEQRSRPFVYLLAGLSMGFVYWVKEVGILAVFAFLFYPLWFRKFDIKWSYVVLGGIIMLVAHFALMQFVSGDPFHLIKVVTSQINRGVASPSYEDSPFYYFKYLFFDIKHTWIAVFAALAGLIGFILGRIKASAASAYVVWWLLSLIIIMSFFPVSFSPLHFAMKQFNYVNLFFAPIALLAAIMLDRYYGVFAKVFIALAVSGGVVLAAFEQQNFRVFTANSYAAIDFLRMHPGEWLLGSSNNGNIAGAVATAEEDFSLATHYGFLAKGAAPANWDHLSSLLVPRDFVSKHGNDGYVLIDPQTINWGLRGMKFSKVPTCWNEVGRLSLVNLGFGHYFVEASLLATNQLPGVIANPLRSALLPINLPKQGVIYRVNVKNLWCASN